MSSTKNAQPYYPHNANARNEDNMIRLRMAHGVAGYGVYHMLLERLRMSEGYKCELDYDILCWDLDCGEDLIRSVIYDFGLFEIVDDGQRFSSVELNAYMQLMEQKAAERKARAQEAANARWGNKAPMATPVSTAEQPQLPLEEESPVKNTERLDKEIESIKADERWLDEMAKESGKPKEEILSFLPEFRTQCMLRGMKEGHKDMADALTHFRSWIYKSGRAKDPNARLGKTYEGNRRGKVKEKDMETSLRIDRESAKRAEKWREIEEKKVDIKDYIRNKGYDPSKVTIVQLMQPSWQEQNPPTHPEWIGAFIKKEPEPIDVPY